MTIQGLAPLYEPFEGSWDRLARARRHATAFYEEWRTFLKGDAYRFLIDVDPSGEGRYYVKRNQPIGSAAGLELGEMLYNLRAALDGFVYDCAVLDSGQFPPPDHDRLEFPICDTPKGFKNSDRKIAPLNDRAKDAIASVQTYRASAETDDGNLMVINGLAMLNDLARRDRHRRLHVVGGWRSVIADKAPALILPEGVTLRWFTVAEDGFFDEEGDIARFGLQGWKPTMEIGSTPNISIGPEIDEARLFMPEFKLTDRILRMQAAVIGILGYLAYVYGKGVPGRALEPFPH